MKLKSIASKLILAILPIIVVSTFVFIILTYAVSKAQMDLTINNKMQESLALADSKITSILNETAEVSYHLSLFAENNGEQLAADETDFESRKENSKKYLVQMIRSFPNIMGGGIWYAKDKLSDTFGESREFYSHYAYKNPDYDWAADNKGGGTDEGMEYVVDYAGDGDIDFHEEEWFVDGHPRDTVSWSGVYYDPVAKTIMVTASFSFYDTAGEFLGITTVDMSLDAIRSITSSLAVGRTGKAFLLGKGGEYISFFEGGKDLNSTMQQDDDPNLAKVGDDLIKNTSGQTSLKRGSVNNRVYFKTIAGTRWILAIAVDESEISSSALNSMFILIIVPILGLVLSALCILFMARRLKRVTTKVNDFAGLAGGGDFSRRIEVTENDEFGIMERNLNKMVENMQEMSTESAKMLELAQSASRSKSDFLSRMSHEIRTPMNAIIGMTQIARKSDDSEKIADCLKKTENASRHLLSLINDILDMSKIEANKLELISTEFKLEKTVSNIYNFIAFKVEEKHQTFSVFTDDNIPVCLIGDELRFSQVITNLLSNAVKFTPQGGKITLDIKQIASDDKYSTLEVTVGDSGIGMSDEQLSRMFTPFEQAERNTSKKYGGTGLGLAISKNIVELAGGHIRVESELEKGSRFIFDMRFLKGENELKENLNLNLGELKILAVDGSADSLEYFKRLLNSISANCDAARNTQEAVEILRAAEHKNQPYDIVFLDYMLQPFGNIGAPSYIKSVFSDAVVAVMIPALDLHIHKAELLSAGISTFLIKPFNSSDVSDTLQQLAVNFEKCRKSFSAADADFSGYTVLLAEDIEINREIVFAALEGTGIKMDFAVNGKDAIEKFTEQKDKYSLILMDLQMPEMDGLEATKQIRKIDQSIPIVAMTANAFKEDIDTCLAAGMNDHLAKPIDFELIIEKLSKYIKGF